MDKISKENGLDYIRLKNKLALSPWCMRALYRAGSHKIFAIIPITFYLF